MEGDDAFTSVKWDTANQSHNNPTHPDNFVFDDVDIRPNGRHKEAETVEEGTDILSTLEVSSPPKSVDLSPPPIDKYSRADDPDDEDVLKPNFSASNQITGTVRQAFAGLPHDHISRTIGTLGYEQIGSSSSPKPEEFESLEHQLGEPEGPLDSSGGAEALEEDWLRGFDANVSDPKKHGQSMKDAYISYLVTTKNHTTNRTFSVRRRFQDFRQLHTHLFRQFTACIVPPLPDKHRLEYITGDRFSGEFVERRRCALQRFLNRVSRHRILRASTPVKAFLTEEHLDLERLKGKRRESTVFDNISDALLNAFSKLSKPDPKFEDIKDYITKFEESLQQLERITQRTVRKSMNLEQDYNEFGASVTTLGVMESSLTEPLTKMGRVFYEYSQGLDHLTQHEDVEFLGHLREYLAYCHSVKCALKLRDHKQLDYEELSDFVAKTEAERSKVANRPVSGSPYGLSSATNSISSFGQFFRDRYSEIRSSASAGSLHPEQAKHEKLQRIDVKLKELREEATKSQQEAEAFSDEVEKEIKTFEMEKETDFRAVFGNLVDKHVRFYERGLDLWENIIPELQADAKGKSTK